MPHLISISDVLTDWLTSCDLNWQEQRVEFWLEQLPTELQSQRGLALIELVKIDLAQMWRRGREVFVESYLDRFPELGTVDSVAAELIVAEIEARERTARPASEVEIGLRFPKHIDAVRQRVAATDMLKVAAAISENNSQTTLEAQKQTASVKPGDTEQADAKGTGGPICIGTAFGANRRYRIVKELGGGGMGSVYLATDGELGDRKVAIKVPRFALTEDLEMLDRFKREAALLAALSHPNLGVVFDVNQFDGTHYLVMEFIDGESLGDYLSRHSFTPPQAISLVRKVASALHAAHAAGVVHRDMKPENIMLTKTGQPKVIDFGLAVNVQHNTPRVTRTGTSMGTPEYMPIEQLRGDLTLIGPRSDIYSLGVVLFKLLTGLVPFPGDNAVQVFEKIAHDDAPSPQLFRPDLDPPLTEIVLKAIAKQPADRFASMSDFERALAAYSKSVLAASGIDTPISEPPPVQLGGQSLSSLAKVLVEPSIDTDTPNGTEPTSQSVEKRTPPHSPSSRRRVAVALTFAAAILLGAIIWFRSGDAVVKVEILVDDVDVSFVNESIKIIDDKTEYRVKPGPHRLHIKTGNVEFDSETFTLKRGGNPVVKIEPTNNRLIAKFGEARIGSTPLAARKLIPTTPPAAVAVASKMNSDSRPVAEAEAAKFAGNWLARWKNGFVHHYQIGNDGGVYEWEINQGSQLYKHGNDVLLDYNEDKLERFSIRDQQLHVEQWFPRGDYFAGKPPSDVAIGELVTTSDQIAAFIPGLSPGKWHDLLAMVKLPDHVVCGNWKQSPTGMLSSDPSVMPAVMIPVIIDGGYELDLEYARMSGKESVSITVPVGAGRTSIVTSGWGGKFHGLIEVDRVPLPELDSDSGAITSPGTLENLRRNRLHIDVDVKNNEGHIQAVLNDQHIVDWTGDVQRLLPLTDAAMPCDRVPCLHSWISSADFRSLRLRLKPGARAVRLGDDWSNPLTVVRDAPPVEIVDKCLKWNDRSYYLSDVPMHLTEAQSLASRWNGRLLTVSSQAEEDFLAANDGGRTFWTSGWRRWDDKQWRDDLNRPLRFLGGWSRTKPLDSETHSRLILWPCGLGWSNEQRQATAYACIEWGQEYAPGSSDAVVIAPPKVAATDPPRPKDEPWADPDLSKKPNVIHGKWWLEGEELVTQSVAPRNLMTFGDVDWKDYDLKVEASCDKIGVSYNLFLRWFEEENFWLLQFGNYGAKNMDLVAYVPGEYGWRMPTRRYMPNSLHGEAKVWHHIEVKVRGINIIVLVDGQVMTTSSHPKLHHGCVGLHTFSEGNARWRNLEVRTPDGKLLWKGFPTLPPEQLSETAQSYKAACEAADEFLRVEFDKVIKRMRMQKTDFDEAARQTLAAIQEEQAHFQSHQRIPFSPAMRAASIAYLKQIEKARKEFEVAIDRRLAELKNTKAPTALEESNTLAAEKTRYLVPRIVGVWELYTPNGVFHDVTLKSDGTLTRSIGHLPGTWTLDEKHLVFTSRRLDNPAENYVDTNIVSDDGRTYAGSNQLGFKFTGKRKRLDN